MLKELLNRKISPSNIGEMFFLILLTAVSIFGYLLNSESVIAYCVLFLLVRCVVYGVRGELNYNITFLAFLLAYFTFLLTRIIFPLFFNTDQLALDLGETVFKTEINVFVNLALYIALLSVYLGYRLSFTANNKSKESVIPFYESMSVRRVRKISKYAAILFSLFAFLSVIDQVRYVLTYGYLDFYLNYKSSIPYIFVFLGTFFDYFVMFFLATMPSKKEARWIIIIYLLVNITSIGMGQRGGAVLSIIFVISYFFIRNRINPGRKPWIGKRGIVTLVLLIPVLISFLFLVSFIRSDREYDGNGSTNLIVNFFYQQGVSVNVLGYAKKFDNILPDGKLYSAGKIIDFVNHNAISQVLFDTDPVKPQTVEHAMDDHTLHATLTYLGSPNLYFSGGGYGGCYIADLWVDFGFIGIVVGSLIFGVCLANIRKWCSQSFWKASVGLLMYTNIIFAPRSNFIDFIYVFIPITAIIVFTIVFFIKNKIVIKNGRQNSISHC